MLFGNYHMLDLGVMGFFKSSIIWYCEQNLWSERLDTFPLSGDTGGMGVTHLGLLQTANQNHWT